MSRVTGIGGAFYGKFGWIYDSEGNKVELWEPDDDKFKFEAAASVTTWHYS